MRERLKQGLMVLLASATLVAFLPPATAGSAVFAAKAGTPHLNKTSVNLVQGNKKKLKVKGLERDAMTGKKPKVRWISNKPGIASVNSKGVVTARRAGGTHIVAKVRISKKKTLTLRCKVKVTRRTCYNARQVWKYVRKHGKLDNENEGTWARTVGRNPSITIDSGIGTDKLEFYSNRKPKAYPAYGTVYMDSQLLDNNFNNQVYVEIQLSENSRDLYTLCGTISRAYDGGTAGIEFTSVLDRTGAVYSGFTEEQLAVHKAEAVKATGKAFRKFDTFTRKKTGFGMKDIGFTRWK